MASYTELILIVVYLSTVDAQTFCEDVISRGETCFGAPEGCSGEEDCEMTMAAVDNNDTFTITLTGQSDGWIALAFSGDKLMGRDDVIMCIYNGINVTVEHRYNEVGKKSNIEGTYLPENLVRIQGSFDGGVINCTFNRTKTVDGIPDVFGLVVENDEPSFHAFFGKGPVTNGQPLFHPEFPWTSNDPVNLASGTVIEFSRRGGSPPANVSPSTPQSDTGEGTTPTSAGVIRPANFTWIVILLLAYLYCF